MKYVAKILKQDFLLKKYETYIRANNGHSIKRI